MSANGFGIDESPPSFYSPRRIFAIIASIEKTDLVAVWVFQVGLSPEPGAIGWWFGEFEAEGREAFEFGVEVGALEIQDDVVQGLDRSQFAEFAHRQGRFAVGTFETSVSREGIDDTFQAQLFEEFDRFDGLFGVDGYLIEDHFLGFIQTG